MGRGTIRRMVEGSGAAVAASFDDSHGEFNRRGKHRTCLYPKRFNAL